LLFKKLQDLLLELYLRLANKIIVLITNLINDVKKNTPETKVSQVQSL